MYIVMLDWFDVDTEIAKKMPAYFFFPTAEDALEFANAVCREKVMWERFECPKDMYLYRHMGPRSSYSYFKQGFSEEQRYLAAWLDCDKYIKE